MFDDINVLPNVFVGFGGLNRKGIRGKTQAKKLHRKVQRRWQKWH